MARKYRYTDKFVVFTGATGEKVRVSKATQEELQRLTRKANRQRNKLLRELYASDDRRFAVEFEVYKQILDEDEYIPKQKTQDLTKFRSAKDIQRQIKALKCETKRNFTDYRAGKTKQIYIERINDYAISFPGAEKSIRLLNSFTSKQMRELSIKYEVFGWLNPSDRQRDQVVIDWLNEGLSALEMIQKEGKK